MIKTHIITGKTKKMSIKNIFNVKNNIKFTSKMILIKNESSTLQTTTARKPLMGYGNKSYIKKSEPLINL